MGDCLVARQRPRRPQALAMLLVATATGCATATPLMHPAEVQPPGTWQTSAGVSTHLLDENAEAQLAEAESETPFVTERSGLLRATSYPGVAPWTTLRYGLSHQGDLGLGLTARSLRVDGRYVFGHGGPLGASLGAGVSALRGQLSSGEDAPPSPGAGVGVDLPVLVGWHSRGDIVSIWAGARYAFNWYPEFEGTVSLSSLRRQSAGGMLGLSVGVEPVWVRLELQVAREWAEAETGSGDPLELAFTSVNPAGGLSVRF